MLPPVAPAEVGAASSVRLFKKSSRSSSAAGSAAAQDEQSADTKALRKDEGHSNISPVHAGDLKLYRVRHQLRLDIS